MLSDVQEFLKREGRDEVKKEWYRHSEFDQSPLYVCMWISQGSPFVQLIYTNKN
jgi:hypothetical protein